MRQCLGLVVLFVATIGAFGAQAEPAVDEAVRETLETYIAAMRDGEYEKMAGLMHPEDLKQFKKLYLLIAIEAEEADAFDELRFFLGGIRSAKDLEATTPEKFFATFMSALIQVAPDLGAILKTAKVTLLGQVTEGGDDELLHVVHRMEMEMEMEMEVEGEPISTLDVTSMRKTAEGDYRLILDEMAWGVTRSLQKRFGIKEGIELD